MNCIFDDSTAVLLSVTTQHSDDADTVVNIRSDNYEFSLYGLLMSVSI